MRAGAYDFLGHHKSATPRRRCPTYAFECRDQETLSLMETLPSSVAAPDLMGRYKL